MNIAAFEGLTPLEIFRKLAPEFAAVPDEVVQGYIDLLRFMCVLMNMEKLITLH